MVKYIQILTATLFLLFPACDDSTGIIPPVLPHNPVDQGWKAVENLEYAFNQRDSELLDETLDPNFLFLLPEEEWDDYNGDGIVDTTLTRELFMSSAVNLFQEYGSVELEFSGSSENPWAGDTTGTTMMYVRDYFMEVSQGTQEGWTTTGQTILHCRPDSSETWRVTWIEYSQDE
ncbi:MAG TPA: hypothetical protein P5207_00160 [Candidatus Sabulitectum sp.]|mgnify:CR=1 FL=1|nr:hypothetical protein [Candidatus Sabulitectum sp.]HRW77057.1 hypothetical protein [Candidatus Sabulitectum sp.]